MEPLFKDMCEVGRMLNAVLYASRNAPELLVDFKLHQLPIRETIRLTGGLLYLSIYISKKMIDRYKDNIKVYQFHEIVKTFEEYEPAIVEIDMEKNGLFNLIWVNGEFRTPIEAMSGKTKLFTLTQNENEGFAFGQIYRPEYAKEGDHISTMTELIESTVEDFAFAAEEFIYIAAKELNLKPVDKPQRANLRLAA